MGVRNYLVEGVSGTGKTTVCTELNRRGHHAVHGDRELVVWLHRTREDVPATGIRIDAARPVSDVVDEILRHAGPAAT